MIRMYDLEIHEDKVNQLLNNPELALIKMDIHISEETAYTHVSLEMKKCMMREPKFERRIERYVLFFSHHPRIDELMADPDIQILKKHIKGTQEGIIAVIDYQKRRRKKVVDGGEI